MTDRKQALEALRDKVRDGDWCTRLALKALPESHVNSTNDWVEPIGWASRAFHNGSLDAAKALHEAVLPGCRARIDVGRKFRAWVITGENVKFSAYSHTPARAWLIAILSALMAQEDAQ